MPKSKSSKRGPPNKGSVIILKKENSLNYVTADVQWKLKRDEIQAALKQNQCIRSGSITLSRQFRTCVAIGIKHFPTTSIYVQSFAASQYNIKLSYVGENESKHYIDYVEDKYLLPQETWATENVSDIKHCIDIEGITIGCEISFEGIRVDKTSALVQETALRAQSIFAKIIWRINLKKAILWKFLDTRTARLRICDGYWAVLGINTSHSISIYFLAGSEGTYDLTFYLTQEDGVTQFLESITGKHLNSNETWELPLNAYMRDGTMSNQITLRCDVSLKLSEASLKLVELNDVRKEDNCIGPKISQVSESGSQRLSDIQNNMVPNTSVECKSEVKHNVTQINGLSLRSFEVTRGSSIKAEVVWNFKWGEVKAILKLDKKLNKSTDVLSNYIRLSDQQHVAVGFKSQNTGPPGCRSSGMSIYFMPTNEGVFSLYINVDGNHGQYKESIEEKYLRCMEAWEVPLIASVARNPSKSLEIVLRIRLVHESQLDTQNNSMIDKNNSRPTE